MSKDHKGDNKEYRILSESTHAHHIEFEDADVVDEVMFGFYAPGGGSSGEMGMRWHYLGEVWQLSEDSIWRQVRRFVPRLECYCDSWHALAQLKNMIDELAAVDSEDITPRTFCQILERCGFVDKTERKVSMVEGKVAAFEEKRDENKRAIIEVFNISAPLVGKVEEP